MRQNSPLNEFELQEQDSSGVVQAKQEEDFKSELQSLFADMLYADKGKGKEGEDGLAGSTKQSHIVNRLEDLEHKALQLPEEIIALVPSDSLETVKARLNQVIEALNNSRL